MKRSLVVLACVLAFSSSQGLGDELEEDDFIAKKWRDSEFALPAPPIEASLAEFQAGVASTNRFFVDLSSLAITAEGVVRYVLLVESSSGVRTVSYEGIRCESRERRIYALGRSDGSWVKARNTEWARIRETAINRQHAVLYLQYFCPDGIIVPNAETARALFKRGGHSPYNSLY